MDIIAGKDLLSFNFPTSQILESLNWDWVLASSEALDHAMKVTTVCEPHTQAGGGLHSSCHLVCWNPLEKKVRRTVGGTQREAWKISVVTEHSLGHMKPRPYSQFCHELIVKHQATHSYP